MRTTAEVGERTLCVGGDVTIFEVVDKLTLIVLSPFGELLQSIFFGDGCTHELLFACHELLHLLLNLLEVSIFEGYAFGWIDIVVEAILDSRTNTELDTWPKLLECLCHQVRRGVPESVFSFGIVPLVEHEGSIGKNRES